MKVVRPRRVISACSISPRIKEFEYAVRGELAIKASEYMMQLKEGKKLPFDEVVFCNIGNPQQLGQKPITFTRQVISTCENPALLETNFIPQDVKDRAREYLAEAKSTGAYTDSRGLLHVRKAVCRYINRRDGRDENDTTYTNPDLIFLSDGASPAIQQVLKLIIRHPTCGIMIPIPQYPLYSATVPLLGGSSGHYFLNESQGWSLDVKELKRAVHETRQKGIDPRALTILNPGNPTGQCLSVDNIESIIDFAYREGLVILADEVYQSNCYEKTKPFHSFKSVLHKMGQDYSDMELFSFHSTSKGLEGECGKRGGYVEFQGIDASARELFYKMQSVNLCPNVPGQIALGCIVDPPKPGQPSYATWSNERQAVFDSLQRRAQIVRDTLNQLPGVSCQTVEGALYAFPTITIPKRAVEVARALGKQPDTMYCLELLDKTGLCVVPGSGFGQVDGTFHFRITILPPESSLSNVLGRLTTFHNEFLAKYSDNSRQ